MQEPDTPPAYQPHPKTAPHAAAPQDHPEPAENGPEDGLRRFDLGRLIAEGGELPDTQVAVDLGFLQVSPQSQALCARSQDVLVVNTEGCPEARQVEEPEAGEDQQGGTQGRPRGLGLTKQLRRHSPAQTRVRSEWSAACAASGRERMQPGPSCSATWPGRLGRGAMRTGCFSCP